MKQIELAAGWINTDRNGKEYIKVVLKDNFEVGQALYLRKNDFKKPGESSPDYRYTVGRSETANKPSSESEAGEDISNDVPF